MMHIIPNKYDRNNIHFGITKKMPLQDKENESILVRREVMSF